MVGGREGIMVVEGEVEGRGGGGRREQWWVRGDEGRGVASVCYNTFGYVSLQDPSPSKAFSTTVHAHVSLKRKVWACSLNMDVCQMERKCVLICM